MSVETVMPGTKRLATELRAELARRQISGAELGRRLGVSQATTSRWLNGLVAMDTNQWERLSEATGISFSDLVAAARFRCTQPSSDPAFPSQLRRHGAGVERYTGPLRRASDCVA